MVTDDTEGGGEYQKQRIVQKLEKYEDDNHVQLDG